MHMYVLAHGIQMLTSSIISQGCTPCLLRQILSLGHGAPQIRLAREVQESGQLCLPSVGITSTCHCDLLFALVTGIEPRF